MQHYISSPGFGSYPDLDHYNNRPKASFGVRPIFRDDGRWCPQCLKESGLYTWLDRTGTAPDGTSIYEPCTTTSHEERKPTRIDHSQYI